MKKIMFLFSLLLCSIITVNAAEYNSYTMGQEIKYDPVKGELCKNGDTCYTWHVIKNSSKTDSKLSILMNQNLGEKVLLKKKENVTTDNRSTEVASQYLIDLTKTWKYQARLITEEEIFSIFNISQFPTQYRIEPTEETRWLFTDNIGDTYWTAIDFGMYAEVIDTTVHHAYLAYNAQYFEYYVRPLIDIDKKEIKEKTISSQNGKVEITAYPDIINKIAKINVSEISENDQIYQKIKKLFPNSKKIKVYSFVLYDSDNKLVEPSGEVTVKMNLNKEFTGDGLSLWYVNDKIEKQELEYELKKDVLTFKTTHFSNYVLTEGSIVKEETSTDKPNNSNNNTKDEINDSKTTTQIVKVSDTAMSVYKAGYIIGLVILVLGIMVLVQVHIQSKQEEQNNKEKDIEEKKN